MQPQQEAAISDIFVSPLNPRRTYNKDKDAELLGDVKVRGVLQPVLVREAPKGPKPIELIFGTRRLKAATAAELKTIPIRFVTMSDQEVIEAAISENDQRDDIHPLEEAEGYELLARPPKNATYKALTVDEIAARFGKSRSAVYARMKLLDLTKENRKRFYDGKLDASRALLLARIPASLQDKAGKEIEDGERGQWSYRDAHAVIVRNYMLRLADAPFDLKDAQLVAKAGACAACPKRTGNQAELFADVASADVCTDPGCFKAKKEAHADKLLAEARAKKQEILPATKVKTAFYNYGGGAGYHVNEYASGYREAAKDTPADKVVLAKTPDGEVHRLVKKAEPKKAKASSSSSSSSKPAAPKKPDPAELGQVRGEARAMDQLVAKLAAGAPIGVWRGVILAFAKCNSYEFEALLKRRTLGADKLGDGFGRFKGDCFKAVAKIVKNAKSVAQLQALVVDALFGPTVENGDLPELEPAFRAAGVDLKAHVKKATEEIAAAQAPGPKKKPEAKKPTPKNKAKK